MSPIFKWVVNLLIMAGCGVFIFFYLDAGVLFSALGIYSVLLYFLLSVITGIRYKNIIYDSSQLSIPNIDIFRIPAAMNLAGYLIPVKGGGVWLFFYLKRRYDFSSTKSLILASFNMLFLFFSVVFFVFLLYLEVELGVVQIAFCFLGYALVLVCIRFFLRKNAVYKITWRFTFVDFFLVIGHFSILSLLCYFLVGPFSAQQSFSMALFLLVSSVIKITPGNIGVLEGAAILAAHAVPEYGDLFPALAASYRSLSIFHAVVAGVPSMIALSLKRQGASQ